MAMIDRVQFESKANPVTATKSLFSEIQTYLKRNELLTITMEECAEVTVEASKVIRFSAEDTSYQPTLEREIGDLLCMVDLLKEAGMLSDDGLENAKQAKREKLKKWSNLDV